MAELDVSSHMRLDEPIASFLECVNSYAERAVVREDMPARRMTVLSKPYLPASLLKKFRDTLDSEGE